MATKVVERGTYYKFCARIQEIYVIVNALLYIEDVFDCAAVYKRIKFLTGVKRQVEVNF